MTGPSIKQPTLNYEATQGHVNWGVVYQKVAIKSPSPSIIYGCYYNYHIIKSMFYPKPDKESSSNQHDREVDCHCSLKIKWFEPCCCIGNKKEQK